MTELEAAIALAPELADLQYDLGLVYERLGRLDAAIVAYRQYRQRARESSERARAARIITRIEGARREALRAAAAGVRSGRADGAFWATVGGAGVALGAAGGTLALGIVEEGRSDSLQSQGATEESRVARDRATAAIVAAGVGFGLSAGLGLTAGLVYALRSAPRGPTALTWMVDRADREGLGVRVVGRF